MKKMAATAVIRSLLLLIFLVVGCLQGISAGKGRIVGGQPNHIRNAPYIVSLRIYGQLHCGGTLITPIFVLTAAHCVYNRRPEEIEVYAGESKLTNGGKRRKVKSFITPSTYDPVTHHMDVGLVLLNEPLIDNDIRTIPLCDRSVPEGERVEIHGWGTTTEGGSASDHLLTTVVPVKNKSFCQRLYYPLKLTDSMLCAGEPGKDHCHGDSGGPVVWRNRVCAIVSFAIGCATNRYPGVNTDVYAVRQFIIDVINKYSPSFRYN